MSVSIRPAKISDLNALVDLLLIDAEQRCIKDQILWKLETNAREKVAATTQSSMESKNPPFRQQWLLAEANDKVVGVTHSILLPVPPIYAGEMGAPGVIMEDCFVLPNAPEGTAKSLLKAAEIDLIEAGAKTLVASSVAGGAWEVEFAAQNYEPLTLYLGKFGLNNASTFVGVRDATENDLPSIVTSSATNRRILSGLDPFWKPHPDAAERFGIWMNYSLTLPDRDMFVSQTEGQFEGYAISQPSTPLHLPAPHDITGTGIIDDFHHADFEDLDNLKGQGRAASTLLQAAEGALKVRGNNAALIVCPAAWASKISVLKSQGYETAITWFIKR